MKDLLAWFGLKRYPFDKNIKTRDVLETEPLKECPARLDYIKRRGGIMLLTGDPGVGKTLALRRYVDSLNENLFRCHYTPLSTLSRIDLLHHLNRLLGLPRSCPRAPSTHKSSTSSWNPKNRRGKTVVLIIDEAQLLQTGPLEELRLLTNFKMDSYDPFILVLCRAERSETRHGLRRHGALQPAPRHALPHAPAQPRGDHLYVTHHLKLAGATEPLFDEAALRPSTSSPSASPEESAPSPNRPSPTPCSTRNALSPPTWSSKSKPWKDSLNHQKEEIL